MENETTPTARSAASRPNKARSARQEVDLWQVYSVIKLSRTFCAVTRIILVTLF